MKWQKISELEDRSTETMKLKKRNKIMNESEQSLREMWDTTKHNIICITRSTKKEVRKD